MARRASLGNSRLAGTDVHCFGLELVNREVNVRADLGWSLGGVEQLESRPKMIQCGGQQLLPSQCGLFHLSPRFNIAILIRNYSRTIAHEVHPYSA